MVTSQQRAAEIQRIRQISGSGPIVRIERGVGGRRTFVSQEGARINEQGKVISRQQKRQPRGSVWSKEIGRFVARTDYADYIRGINLRSNPIAITLAKRQAAATPQERVVVVRGTIVKGTTQSIKEKYKNAILRTRKDALASKLPLRDQVSYSILKRQGKNPQITGRGVEWRERNKNFILSQGQYVGVTGSTKKLTIDPQRIARLEATVRQKRIEKAIKEEKKILKKPVSEITAEPKLKGLAGIQQKLAKKKRITLTDISRSKVPEQRIFKGIFVLGTLGAARGLLGFATVVRHPIQSAKNLWAAARTPVQTFRALGQEFTVDPVGVMAEFYIYNKALNLAGRGIKKSPVGRYVQEEIFIRSQPKTVRPAVRRIIKSAKVQEKINPFGTKGIRPDFTKIKSLTKVEARALVKTLRQTDSVVFGSQASRVLSKKRTPVPKDVDLATRNIHTFNRKFINNLPKKYKKGYAIKGQKIIRLSNKEAIMDIKPLDRLIPQKNLLTGKGRIPTVGYVNKLVRKKGSILPTIVKKPGVSRLEFPTQKIVKIKGIKFVGFGEQTVRKGLGTLQVLIEKSVRRAKDPQGFLISLKIQREVLKASKPITKLGRIRLKSRIKTLTSAIRMLESKGFAKLLEKKVPGITKRYPLVAKINTIKLKKIDLRKVNKAVKTAVQKKIIPKGKPPTKAKIVKALPKTISKQRFQTLSNKLSPKYKATLTKGLPSKLPSRLPSRLLSRLPSSLLGPLISATFPKLLSDLPERSVTLLPRKIPSKFKAKPSRIRPSRIKPSRIKPSKVPPSKIPPSKIPPIKIPPPSKIPPSKLTPSIFFTSKIPVSKIPISKLPFSNIPLSKIPLTKVPIFKLPLVRPPLVKLTWEDKMPRNYVRIVNVIVRIKGKNRILKLKTTPNRALKKIIGLVDTTTTRSFQLMIIGVRKGKDIKKQSRKKFRLKKRKGTPVLKFVERSRYAIDSKGEVTGLSIARALSKKPIKRRKKKPIKRRKKRKTRKKRKKKR